MIRAAAAASQVLSRSFRVSLPTSSTLPTPAWLHSSASVLGDDGKSSQPSKTDRGTCKENEHSQSSQPDGGTCKDNEPLTKRFLQKDLPPHFIKFIESGFLQAMRELRDSLLEEEWESHGKRAAQRAAVAGFEAALAAEGRIGLGQPDQPKAPSQVSYHTLTLLYHDPDNLDVIEDDVLRARLRALMHQSLDERMREAYRDATSRAEDMARLLKEGPGSIVEIIQRLLPIPNFLKGK